MSYNRINMVILKENKTQFMKSLQVVVITFDIYNHLYYIRGKISGKEKNTNRIKNFYVFLSFM